MSVHVLNPVHSPRVLDLVRVLLRVWRCGSVFACRPPFPTHTAFCFCSPVPVLHRFGVSDHVHFLVRHTHVGVVCVQSLDSVSACSASCKRSSAACVRTYPLFVLLGAAGLSTGIESGVSRAATGWHYLLHGTCASVGVTTSPHLTSCSHLPTHLHVAASRMCTSSFWSEWTPAPGPVDDLANNTMPQRRQFRKCH